MGRYIQNMVNIAVRALEKNFVLEFGFIVIARCYYFYLCLVFSRLFTFCVFFNTNVFISLVLRVVFIFNARNLFISFL